MKPNPDNRSSFVIGGARSGKSAYAETIVTHVPSPWIYIATAQAFDDEMSDRIAQHRARRAAGWTTIEAPLALPEVLAQQLSAARPILIDCLTLWLSNLMLAEWDSGAESQKLIEVLRRPRNSFVVVVSNEVGLGIVPENALARRFRDAQGRLNQLVAASADRVVLMAAGLPLVLKPTARTDIED